jgi:DNA-binding transcriptional regulator LsrR (DeoR family)
MARVDELRLMTKVARLYYERDLTQPAIAAQLDLSQATVSRLLKRAKQEQIVRISVSVPSGAYPALEEALQKAYGLKEAVVVDSVEDDDQILRDIGAAAAFYLESTLIRGEIIGISSWSATILAMVNAMHPVSRPADIQLVQILGGVGNPTAAVYASHLISRLASLVGGQAALLPAPGVAGSAGVKAIFLEDKFVQEALALFDKVTLALVGIGTVEPSGLLASSGNIFSPQELDMLRQAGAVGDICLRFFDSEGRPVATPLDARVIGMTLDQLRPVRRAVALAGGRRKITAIRAALLGGLVNVLVTDRFTAQQLIDGHAAPRDAALAPAAISHQEHA